VGICGGIKLSIVRHRQHVGLVKVRDDLFFRINWSDSWSDPSLE